MNSPTAKQDKERPSPADELLRRDFGPIKIQIIRISICQNEDATNDDAIVLVTCSRTSILGQNPIHRDIFALIFEYEYIYTLLLFP